MSESGFCFLTSSSSLSIQPKKCRFCDLEFTKFSQLIKHESTHCVLPPTPTTPPSPAPEPVQVVEPKKDYHDHSAISLLKDEDFDEENIRKVFAPLFEDQDDDNDDDGVQTNHNKNPIQYNKTKIVVPKRDDELEVLERVQNYEWSKDAEKFFCTQKQQHQLKCRRCGECLESRWTLFHHILIHDNEKPYKCQLCDLRFTQAVNREEHESDYCTKNDAGLIRSSADKIKKNHRIFEKKDKSVLVKAKNRKKVDLDDNSIKNVHVKQGAQKLKTANNSTAKGLNISTGRISYSDDPNEISLLSENRIQEWDVTLYFDKIALGNNSSNYKCKTCHKILHHYSRRQLFGHKLRDDGLIFGCRFCSRTFYTSYLKRNKHESAHIAAGDPIKFHRRNDLVESKHGQKRKIGGWKKFGFQVNNPGEKVKYECFICNNLFSRSWNLKVHNLDHHNIQNKSYEPCQFCKVTTFPNQMSRSIHESSCVHRLKEQVEIESSPPANSDSEKVPTPEEPEAVDNEVQMEAEISL